MEFEVQVLSTDTIKPSSPTPPHLRTYTLGWADQLTHVYHLPVVFFYPAAAAAAADADDRIRALKSSLPRALSRFYPLAGDLVLNTHIDCRDAGARFLRARADADLARFLGGALHPLDHAGELLPCKTSCAVAAEGGAAALLSVQATAFRCGGLALAVCASHKIVDGRSLFHFLQSWAAAAACGDAAAPDPVFDGAAVFPPSEKVVPEKGPARPPGARPLARKGFVIDGAKIAALRSRLPSSTTRVQAVCALLWRCALRARPAPARASVASLIVDTRPRMAPPAPAASFGNRCFCSGAAATKATVELVLARSDAAKGVLEEELGRSLKMMNAEHTQKLREPNGHSSAYALIVDGVIRSRGFEGFDHYFYSSWASLPVYEVDFGWGRPAWVGAPSAPVRNMSLLLPRSPEVDAKGMEAWVAMEEDEMAAFEKDEELLEFAVPFHVVAPPGA